MGLILLPLLAAVALAAVLGFTYASWWTDSLQDNVNHASTGGILSDNTLRMHLFTSPNNLTGAETLASFTEASFAGYPTNGTPLTGFSGAATEGTGPADSYTQGTTVTYTATGSYQTIQGYYVTDAASGKLYWAELFASAVGLSATVNTIQVTPKLTRTTG